MAKDYKENFKKQNENGQLWRADGKDCLVEVIAPNYEDGFTSVTMNFMTYKFDSASKRNKKTGNIAIYFRIPEFLAFCRRIARGDIQRAVMEDKARCLRGEARYYGETPQNNVIRFSGMHMSPDMKRDAKGFYSLAMLRGSNNISRQFFMSAADATRTDNDIVLTALECPGETLDGGITMPKKNLPASEKHTIRVPMPFAKLEEMAEMALMRIYALDVQNAMNGMYKRASYNASDVVEDAPRENTQYAPSEAMEPTQPAQAPAQTQPVQQPVQQTQPAPAPHAPAQTAPQTASEVHKVTGTFITDFQSVGNRSVVKMKIKGKEFMIHFNEPVPDELQKAQKMKIEVSINIIRSESGKFMFHSTL